MLLEPRGRITLWKAKPLLASGRGVSWHYRGRRRALAGDAAEGREGVGEIPQVLLPSMSPVSLQYLPWPISDPPTTGERWKRSLQGQHPPIQSRPRQGRGLTSEGSQAKLGTMREKKV